MSSETEKVYDSIDEAEIAKQEQIETTCKRCESRKLKAATKDTTEHVSATLTGLADACSVCSIQFQLIRRILQD